jgi:HlyD family secretion protein
MDKKLRNRVLLFLLLAGIVAFLLVRMSGRRPVAKISATTPVRRDIVAGISSNGKVEPIAPATVRAQLDTFVAKVHIMAGQNVKKGQLLLELNVKDAASQLAAAKARLLRAEDDLRVAKAGGRTDEAARINGDLVKARAERDRLQRNHDSLTRLLAQGAATKDELTANDLALEKMRAEVNRSAAAKKEFDRQAHLDQSRSALAVQQAQSDVAALQDKVQQGAIRATMDGTLYAMPVHEGDFVRVGDLLAEMADLHKVRVRAFIDEPEMGALEPDEPVKISWDGLPNRVWEGKTEIIPKQVVARGLRNVGELLCSVRNDKLELLPNTNVNVRIILKERWNVLSVSRGAVETDNAQRYVFVVRGGVGPSRLEKRAIQVGIADAANYEIVSGLREGEVVAIPGDVELRDGMRVKVVNMVSSSLREAKDASV